MQMIFEPDSTVAAEAVGERLELELQAGKHVTWFVCGGSNIPLIVRSMAMVPAELTNKLTVLLTDERYGLPGHADSNWKQLDDGGFQPGQATVLRTLRPELTMEDTVKAYAEDVRQAVTGADIVIAQFGIGGDGHIAGILPHTDGSRLAVIDDDTAPWAVGYDGGVFQRVTITPPVWMGIDVAYAIANGEGKRGTLKRLRDEKLSVEEQPSQLLKTVPEAYVYTDQEL